ncbi:MAG: magnesium transporter CorA family protein [Verrucomicrobiae bacterium]|nr:magnesium transporter CorA family protein [Verrucomicrobiae bacterium]
MIRSFVMSEGKVVGQDLDVDALRIVRADKGLHIWVDLFQPSESEVREILELLFGFHPLAIEDCVAPNHLPKVEDYEDYLFLVIHAVDFSRKDKFTTTELDLFLGKEFLVTHHTAPMRSIASAMERLQKNAGQAARGVDRLMHSILDSVVEHYNPVLAEITAEINELEEQIFSESKKPDVRLLQEFRKVKAETNELRQILRPQQEVIARLAAGEFKLIRPVVLPYFRDIRDMLARIDMVAGNLQDQLYLAMDVYLNRVQAHTNEIIKVLAVLTAVTTPVMVIGTWYGMNFEGMLELKPAISYWIIIALTIISTVVLMWWMKKKDYI